jgi:hypothetical protein
MHGVATQSGGAVFDNEGPEVTPATPLPSPGAPLRITMDLLFDGEGRPNGAVWAGASAPQSVLGWLELMSELTRLLSENGPGDPLP